MKNRLGIFLLLLPLAGLADSVVPIDKVENHVNIRLEPDAASDVVGRLNQGSSLELVSEVEGWYEVMLEGDATGFISADWTRVIPDEEVAAEAEPAPEPEAAPEPVVEEAPTEPEVAPEPVVEEAPAAPEPAPEPVVEAVPAEPEPATEPVVEEAPAEPEAAPEPVAEEAWPKPALPPKAMRESSIKGKRDFLVRFKSGDRGSDFADLRQWQSHRHWYDGPAATARGKRQHPDQRAKQQCCRTDDYAVIG